MVPFEHGKMDSKHGKFQGLTRKINYKKKSFSMFSHLSKYGKKHGIVRFKLDVRVFT